jgi:flagellar biosynthetic protein FliP
MSLVPRFLFWVGVVVLLAPAGMASASLPAITVTPDPNGGETFSVSLQVLVVMTALTFLPAITLAMSSFTRIIIVLAILRQALGTMQTPPNQILIGLALLLSVFVMLPVLSRINNEAVQPYLDGRLTAEQAIESAGAPLKEFMLPQTREKDLTLFLNLSGHEQLDSLDSVPFSLLVPAFLTSELKTAFQMGFLILLPFLVIDLIVASVLMAMGMMMLSPMIISLPFKIMLFVLIDGWALVMSTLASSFY